MSNNKMISRLTELGEYMQTLLGSDHYVARSEYVASLDEYSDVIGYFDVLEDSGMLRGYCRKNNVPVAQVRGILERYRNIYSDVEAANDRYVESEMQRDAEYLDNILRDVDPAIGLDDDQKRVVLDDEDYCLVVAGAGAGKTTTIAAKVRYLVDRKGIDPSEILIVSFTNKAVGELRERINRDLRIPCMISTFHSVGYDILRREKSDIDRILLQQGLFYVVQNYLTGTVLRDERTLHDLVLFFSTYFDAEWNGRSIKELQDKITRSNFSTMRSDLDEYQKEIQDRRTRKQVTIQNEVLRSRQEVDIANFLYMNGIDYDYEPVYPYNIEMARKPYTPDFLLRQDGREVYLEHFGLSERGTNPIYSESDIARYRDAIHRKVRIHREHATPLIYTFSEYNDGRPLLEHLQERLTAAGFELRRRPDEEVAGKIASNAANRYIYKLTMLIIRFIELFKVNGCDVDEFGRMRRESSNVRTKLFLNICESCYLEYERHLRENHAIDFNDMINDSAALLRRAKADGTRLPYKYVIIDEFQDISQQRFDLTTAISDLCSARIIAVGDDWQSIYAFSGSKVTLFTEFEKKVGYARMLKIVRTYRNSQEIIDIAGSFVQKNRSQIRKELRSSKHIRNPVIIYTYNGAYVRRKTGDKSGPDYNMALAAERALQHIIHSARARHIDTGKVLLLGRFGFDGSRLEKSGLFRYDKKKSRLVSVKYPDVHITFMTVHSSKGLGYDNVIVLNGRNETYGFPSKIEDDPILHLLLAEDNSIDNAEERRLFYVALTRTKNRVYCIAPEQNPSEFLLEIQRDYKTVKVEGEWNESEPARALGRRCPICGFPMAYRYKESYGLRLYMCTNDPELCDFMTNTPEAGGLAIRKCDSCRDGYLIARKGPTGYFLGCTNYRKDGKGCMRTVSREEYERSDPYAEQQY